MNLQKLGQRLQAVPRGVLYLVLVIVATVPLFFQISVPNKPLKNSLEFYRLVMEVPEGSTVIVQSDWTTSTRGESGGLFEALIRTLMRRNVKFVVYSSADAQAAQVARDVIGRINEERVKKGQEPYKRWEDWISLGFFPDAAATNLAMRTDLKKLWQSRREPDTTGQLRPVFESPVLQNVNSFKDARLFVVITASATLRVAVERLGGQDVPLLAMCTGVMGPEALPLFDSGQLAGLAIGLKGAYDLETMMEYGVNWPTEAEAKLKVPGAPTIAGFPGDINAGRGTRYYPTLHFALGLMILAVVVGNVGMALARKRGGN